jgi:hypothetical protein
MKNIYQTNLSFVFLFAFISFIHFQCRKEKDKFSEKTYSSSMTAGDKEAMNKYNC